MRQLRQFTPYHAYLGLISLLGFGVLAWGLVQVPGYEARLTFGLLLLLAALSAFATTTVAVSEQAGITYQIGSVVSLAAVPSFGIGAAAVIMAVDTVVTWIIKPADKKTWKKSWPQLAFNTGMHMLAVLAAGWVLLLLRNWLGANTVWGWIVAWVAAAFVYEEVNLWLLIGILRLQHGVSIKPWIVWKEDQWATQISVFVLALGGGTLAFALQQYDQLGVAIFFLPIILSAYAFRLYVHQMQTHLDNLEKIVAERTKDLAELSRQKDAYLAVLTHDMMTPLTSIQLCAEELQDDPAAAVDNPHLLTFMLRSQKSLLSIVRNILDIEKLQSGRSLAMHKVDCDLAQLVVDVIGILHAEALEKNISVQYQLDIQPLVIIADRQQMERVLMNLVANAVKYTPSGGAVAVQACIEDNYALIHVKDSGYGIPAAELPYIFDRFQRVEQLKDKATGTGLGLAITKALVEGHAGEITVVSTEGKGSLFSVKLPVDGSR